jgi:hypothetical protein
LKYILQGEGELKLDVEVTNGPKVSLLRTWFAHENNFGPFALGYHVLGVFSSRNIGFPKSLSPFTPRNPVLSPFALGFCMFSLVLGHICLKQPFLPKEMEPTIFTWQFPSSFFFLGSKESKKKLVVKRFEP